MEKLSIYPNAKNDKPINTVVFEDQPQPATSTPDSSIKVGDFVKVIQGSFERFYAFVTGESYGDEIESNCFAKQEKNFVLKENDMDSQLIADLKRVQGTLVNTRGHYSFEE